MQFCANKVILCDGLVDVNQEDMSAQCQHIHVNKHCGLNEDSGMWAEGDRRWNNPLWSGGGRCPTHPTTQATAIIVDNVTQKNNNCSAHGQ